MAISKTFPFLSSLNFIHFSFTKMFIARMKNRMSFRYDYNFYYYSNTNRAILSHITSHIYEYSIFYSFFFSLFLFVVFDFIFRTNQLPLNQSISKVLYPRIKH